LLSLGMSKESQLSSFIDALVSAQSVYRHTIATCPCQTRRDRVEGEGLHVLESRQSRMTCGIWRRLTVDVHKIMEKSKVGTS
jgi:hypothetical protein